MFGSTSHSTSFPTCIVLSARPRFPLRFICPTIGVHTTIWTGLECVDSNESSQSRMDCMSESQSMELEANAPPTQTFAGLTSMMTTPIVVKLPRWLSQESYRGSHGPCCIEGKTCHFRCRRNDITSSRQTEKGATARNAGSNSFLIAKFRTNNNVIASQKGHEALQFHILHPLLLYVGSPRKATAKATILRSHHDRGR